MLSRIKALVAVLLIGGCSVLYGCASVEGRGESGVDPFKLDAFANYTMTRLLKADLPEDIYIGSGYYFQYRKGRILTLFCINRSACFVAPLPMQTKTQGEPI